jgi:Na+-driven multidrug efflux pump
MVGRHSASPFSFAGLPTFSLRLGFSFHGILRNLEELRHPFVESLTRLWTFTVLAFHLCPQPQMPVAEASG